LFGERRVGIKLSRLLSVLILLSAWCAYGHASGYGENPQAQALIDELVTQQGFDRDELEVLFAGAQRKDRILEAIARPAEKTKPWHEYRKIFVTDTRAEQGVEFYRQYAASLQRAEREYGVPAQIIVAIIGVETRYGRNKGSWQVVDALSTLAFDYPKRSKFFSRELREYLLMTRQQGLPAADLKGSYAGAMGYGQFMPSSWRAYAVDFDGDGVVDLINNPVDAIGSVANYFSRHGWRSGEPVTTAARVGEAYRSDWMNDGLKPVHTVAALAEAEIYPLQAGAADSKATAIEFEAEQGPEYWLGWHNFYVITRYNHSSMYAMSVYQLSLAIEEQLSQ
jgi:membrane-bound lytic murein transglycosylase B